MGGSIVTLEQQKFYDIKNFHDYKKIGDDLDYAVIVTDSEIILQFQESQSKTDWKNNFSFLPWPLKLSGHIVWTTHGYAKAYSSGAFIPLTEFYHEHKKAPEKKLIIRGWSFGSAMTKIASRHFILKTGFFLDEVTTFGDVKCWLNPFTQYKKNIKRLREYVTSNDFVTWCVPFYHRTKKCKVGEKFNLLKIFNTPYYHCNYELYDYCNF